MFLVRRWTELKSRAPGASLMGLANTQTLTRSRFRVGKKATFFVASLADLELSHS